MEPEGQMLEREARRRRSLTFLGLLAGLIGAMGLAVVQAAYPAGPGGAGGAGEIRPVPPAVLRSQLRSGRLSDREAEHWRREPAKRPR